MKTLSIDQLAAISEKLAKRFGTKVMVALVANLTIENLIKLAAEL
jgi:hypothetical protein